jgi:hypothetical protein
MNPHTDIQPVLTNLGDGPLDWIAEWRMTLVITLVATLAWWLWWRDAMNTPVRHRLLRRAPDNTLTQEAVIEHAIRLDRARKAAEQTIQTPLTLEEELVSVHNLRMATLSA